MWGGRGRHHTIPGLPLSPLRRQPSFQSAQTNASFGRSVFSPFSSPRLNRKPPLRARAVLTAHLCATDQQRRDGRCSALRALLHPLCPKSDPAVTRSRPEPHGARRHRAEVCRGSTERGCTSRHAAAACDFRPRGLPPSRPGPRAGAARSAGPEPPSGSGHTRHAAHCRAAVRSPAPSAGTGHLGGPGSAQPRGPRSRPAAASRPAQSSPQDAARGGCAEPSRCAAASASELRGKRRCPGSAPTSAGSIRPAAPEQLRGAAPAPPPPSPAPRPAAARPGPRPPALRSRGGLVPARRRPARPRSARTAAASGAASAQGLGSGPPPRPLTHPHGAAAAAARGPAHAAQQRRPGAAGGAAQSGRPGTPMAAAAGSGGDTESSEPRTAPPAPLPRSAGESGSAAPPAPPPGTAGPAAPPARAERPRGRSGTGPGPARGRRRAGLVRRPLSRAVSGGGPGPGGVSGRRGCRGPRAGRARSPSARTGPARPGRDPSSSGPGAVPRPCRPSVPTGQAWHRAPCAAHERFAHDAGCGPARLRARHRARHRRGRSAALTEPGVASGVLQLLPRLERCRGLHGERGRKGELRRAPLSAALFRAAAGVGEERRAAPLFFPPCSVWAKEAHKSSADIPGRTQPRSCSCNGDLQQRGTARGWRAARLRKGSDPPCWLRGAAGLAARAYLSPSQRRTNVG